MDFPYFFHETFFMKIHLCKFQYPIQQQYTYTSNRQKNSNFSRSKREKFHDFSLRFHFYPFDCNNRRELSSCNIYRKFNHSSRVPSVEIPLVLLIRRNFAGATIFSTIFSRCKKQKRKKISREIVSRFIKIVYFFRTRGGCSTGCTLQALNTDITFFDKHREKGGEGERERKIQNTGKIS